MIAVLVILVAILTAGVAIMGYGLYAWLTTSRFEVMDDRQAADALRVQHQVQWAPIDPPVNGYHADRTPEDLVG